MWFQSLINSRSPHQRRRSALTKQSTRRLFVEGLEDRRLMAYYAITELGSLGGYYSYAYDLNEAGQVVGDADTADGVNHAFLWDNGTLIDLGTLGGSYSNARGINDLGQVVGSAYLPGDASAHAFLITPQGGVWNQDSDFDGRNDFMFDLGALNGSDYSDARDINNAGHVVGYSAGQAFAWDAVNGMIDLGTPAGFEQSYATGINETGQVTGTTYFPEFGTNSAFLWDPTNGMAVLGAGPGYTDSDPTGINDAGQLVGYQWDAWAQVDPAFLWTPDAPNGLNGSFTDLGMLPYAIDSRATAVNNAGQVVGTSSVSDSWDYYPHAFVWDAANGMVDLNHQLWPTTDATLEYAAAINEGGAIAVNGYNGSWEYRSYVLTPLSPDPPLVSIADAPMVTEGNAGTVAATFTVTLSVASTETIVVGYSTGNGSAAAGSDYQATSGTLVFAPGETSHDITVQVSGDRVPESNETFVVNLSPTNAPIVDGQARVTIQDDEPRISIGNVSQSEGKNGKTLFTFTITLTVPGGSLGYGQAVTMSYRTASGTASSGSDYTNKTGTLTFAPGETSKTVTIEVKGDNKKEADETFYVDLFALSSNASFNKSRGVGTVVNDD